METKNNDMKSVALRVGVTVFIILAAFTVGEYFIGSIAVGWSAPLALIALIKAAYIIRDYMHLPRLISESEESHS